MLIVTGTMAWGLRQRSTTPPQPAGTSQWPCSSRTRHPGFLRKRSREFKSCCSAMVGPTRTVRQKKTPGRLPGGCFFEANRRSVGFVNERLEMLRIALHSQDDRPFLDAIRGCGHGGDDLTVVR